MFRFTKIDKLVLSSFLGLFVLTFAVVLFILVLVFMLKYFEQLAGKDLGWDVLAELFFYFSLTLVPQALPLSILMASLMTFGNMGEHFELTAIKTCGVPLTRVMLPLGVFAFFMTIGAYFFNDIAIPKINLKAYSLLYDIKQKNPALDLKEGGFFNGLPGYSIRVEKKHKDGETLEGLMIYDHSQNRGNTDLITAQRGTMKTILNDRYLMLEVEDGYKYGQHQLRGRSGRSEGYTREKFDAGKFVFAMEADLERTPEELFANHRVMKNTERLIRDSDSLFKRSDTLRLELVESAKKYYDYAFSTQRKKFPITADDADSIPLDYTVADMNFKDKTMEVIYKKATTKTETLLRMYDSRESQIKKYERDARRELLEMYKKFTFATACFLMFMIGAPLGSIIKKGGLGVPVLLSIVFFIFFYVMGITGDRMSREGAMRVLAGAWMGNVILLGFGLLFWQQARKDSRLFDSDLYRILFEKIKKRLGVKKKAK